MHNIEIKYNHWSYKNSVDHFNNLQLLYYIIISNELHLLYRP